MAEDTELVRTRNRAVTLASRLDPRTASVDDERELAEAMVDVRSRIYTRAGDVDWHARTGEAKSISSEIYSAVKADPDDLRKLKDRMRQHFSRILERRMPSDFVYDEAQEAFVADNDNFYEDVGIFIANLGRRSETDTEAVQLAMAAGKLLDLIDDDAVNEDNPVSVATVLAALQAVSDNALAIHKRLNRP